MEAISPRIGGTELQNALDYIHDLEKQLKQKSHELKAVKEDLTWVVSTLDDYTGDFGYCQDCGNPKEKPWLLKGGSYCGFCEDLHVRPAELPVENRVKELMKKYKIDKIIETKPPVTPEKLIV